MNLLPWLFPPPGGLMTRIGRLCPFGVKTCFCRDEFLENDKVFDHNLISKMSQLGNSSSDRNSNRNLEFHRTVNHVFWPDLLVLVLPF